MSWKMAKNGSVDQHYCGYRMIFQVTYYQKSSLQKLREVKCSILRSIVQIWWTGLNVTRIKQKQTKLLHAQDKHETVLCCRPKRRRSSDKTYFIARCIWSGWQYIKNQTCKWLQNEICSETLDITLKTRPLHWRQWYYASGRGNQKWRLRPEHKTSNHSSQKLHVSELTIKHFSKCINHQSRSLTTNKIMDFGSLDAALHLEICNLSQNCARNVLAKRWENYL